ncbi:MAG: tyrosine-type recombinase/integrase [Microvirga sp.]
MSMPPPLLEVVPFDRAPVLSRGEREALAALGWQLRRRRGHDAARPEWGAIGRLLAPLDAARLALRDRRDTPLHRRSSKDAVGLVLRRCAEEGTTYWGWPEEEWVRLIGEDRSAFGRPWPGWVDQTVRPDVAAYGYLLCGFDAFHRLGSFNRLALAWRVFGRAAVELAQERVLAKLEEWGYRSARTDQRMRTVTAQLLLVNRSARLEDLTDEALQHLRGDPRLGRRHGQFHAVHRAVAGLGFAHPPAIPTRGRQMPVEGASAEWMVWVDRWFATSTLTPEVRREYRSILAKVGRWLAAEQPAIATPADWTRETCAAWVARVTRASVGDYAQRRVNLVGRVGRRLAPTTMASYISTTRTLLRDCQEWGWCARRFDPATALATPRSVRGMLGSKPRVIADDTWAKILWAGLNLGADDLTVSGVRAYPFELVRALALTWLFAGQRSDEIVRLRVGCVRWQPGDVAGTDTAPVCLLDVPVHKTGAAFTKPVDPLLGRAIEAWEAVRPAQPPMTDRKTGEAADLLFACRAHPVANTYINKAVIPMLCRKAGVSPSDVRGRITSHRARATIASQLYNAKEPMTLFELQAWLGHRSPETTQHYAQITPNTLTKAYTDAGYFARNVRTIEVLIDREAVLSGAAAAGESWQHYDLGHGYCSYTFFEQCPHRMACARCDFYIPKPSGRAQLLEAKADVDRRLALIPLTDGERAAVEQDQQAVGRLLEGLANTPTPAGPTPRELATRPSLSPCQPYST